MLTNIETIIKNEIDNNNYLSSLLELSLKYKLITKDIYNEINLKLYHLLKIILKKYTGELNYTISISETKLINNSNLYLLGLYLKNKDIITSLKALTNKNLLSLYDKSKEYLISLVNKTKLFYNTIFKNNILNVDNYFYNITINEGITSFFKNYNTSYETDNHLINLDYNPYLKMTNLYGIEYISKVLEYLNYENIFCSKFKYQHILTNYKNVPINLFEIVFKLSLCVDVLKKDTYSLDITKDDISSLYMITKEDLYNSYYNLKTKLNLSKNINRYLDKCIDYITNDILFAIKNNTLEILLNLNKNKEIYYYTLPKVSNETFIKLKNNLSTDFFLKTKLSFYDFIELLELSNFTNKELFSIFNNLTIIDLMAMKNYLCLSSSNIKDELNRYIYTKDKNIQKFINNNYQNIIIKEKDTF